MAADTPGKHLTVPLLGQHKDTAMLLLERNVETGPHSWDADHGSLDPRDPADNKNCALASIAMVSAFYGGGLSQDRIGYEVISHRTGNPQGPEGDLMYGYGTDGQEALDVLKWALGDVTYPGFMTFEDMWNHVVREIDAGRPIVAANSHHAFVITGYEVTGGRRLISINDPWPGRTYKQDIDHVRLPPSDFNFFLMPATPNVRHQEASVTTDSDGDGVVDFDETERFGTNASSDDGDQDLLRDKQDIITGVFDPQYGYATTGSEAGRDFDSDEIPTERDKDSDSGGCPDGVEDMNGNGHLDSGERSNFNVDDDRRAECESDDVRLHGTFTGHSEGDPLSTSDATFDLNVIWHNPRNQLEPLAFEIESGSFTFSTTIFGVCASSDSEGGSLEMYRDDVQHFVYGDYAEEGRRTASAQILDMRADGGGVNFALTASITLPGNGDPSCEPAVRAATARWPSVRSCSTRFQPQRRTAARAWSHPLNARTTSSRPGPATWWSSSESWRVDEAPGLGASSASRTMRKRIAAMHRAAVFVVVALVLAGCQPGAAGGVPVKFRVALTFDYSGSYDLPIKGSSTLDGTFGLDYLRQQPVEETAKDDATWKTASDQTWSVYESGTNCGLGGQCIPCDSRFTAPEHDVAVGTRIDSRSGDSVVAYVWTYNDPKASDPRYHSGCNSEGEFGEPWTGWGPILITATMGASDVTALAVAPDGPEIIGNCSCSLTIERLP